MLVATTNIIEGKRITTYHGLVTGEAIMGANIFKDLFAGIRDIGNVAITSCRPSSTGVT